MFIYTRVRNIALTPPGNHFFLNAHQDIFIANPLSLCCLLIFDQKWERNLIKKASQEWYLSKYNLIRNYLHSCNFKTSNSSSFFELSVLVATIKRLSKYCSLFPSSKAALFTTSRRKIFIFYLSLLIDNKPFSYCLRKVSPIFFIYIDFFKKVSNRVFLSPLPISYHPSPAY